MCENCSAMKNFRPLSFLILLLLPVLSCEEDNNPDRYSAEIRFDVSSRLLQGKPVAAIDFDGEGQPVIASGTKIYIQSAHELKSIEIGFRVLDLAVAHDNTIWIGTDGGGLGHVTGSQVTWYNKSNAGLPRDVVLEVEVASDGTVWFASCAHLLGGLGSYNGGQFRFYTPENSPLNQNIITDIETGSDGSVYIATSGTVGKTNIYRLHDNSWDCLGNEEGTFYWASSFTLSPKGTIYLVEDFSLSSTMRQNRVHLYGSGSWQILESGTNPAIAPLGAVKADKRNYCWVNSIGEDGPGLMVFNGKEWHRSPGGLIPESFVTTIETDEENNIWIGTYSDGVYILNQ